jgi:hypothetical protein
VDRTGPRKPGAPLANTQEAGSPTPAAPLILTRVWFSWLAVAGLHNLAPWSLELYVVPALGLSILVFRSKFEYNMMVRKTTVLSDRQQQPMGTSTAQRSPRSPEWESVRELYREGVRDASEISRRVSRALGPATRLQMQGPGVVTCLDTLLQGAQEVGGQPAQGLLSGAGSLLEVAARLRTEAERRLATGGLGSRFSDLALDALGSSVMGLALQAPGTVDLQTLSGLPPSLLGSYRQSGRLAELASEFVGWDLDRCFRYLVTRDLSEYVGTSAIPTVSEARQVADAVGAHCRYMASQITPALREDRLLELEGEAPPERVLRLGQPFKDMLDAGLSSIAGR